MDDRLFDDLARTIGRSFTRKTAIKLLGGLSVSGFTSLAGIAGSAAKKHHKRRKPRANDTCQGQDKDGVCHCPPGLHGALCIIQCEEGIGHKDHFFDCLCFEHNPNNPRQLPNCDVCPPVLKPGTRCEPNCSGECASRADCALRATCTCNKLQGQATGTCGAPQTCAGTCSRDAQCPDLDQLRL